MTRDGRRRVLSYEERVLWTTVTKSYTPLRETAQAVADDPVDPPQPRPRKPPPVFVKTPKLPRPAPSAPIAKTVVAKAGPESGPEPALLSRRAKRSVARGQEGIDARLDLHGLTQAEAHGALLRFLRTASARDARLVLIITGKGKRTTEHGERERGVLRRQVPQWLGQPDFRDIVIGFEDAHIAHGGEGALYVRLRRAR